MISTQSKISCGWTRANLHQNHSRWETSLFEMFQISNWEEICNDMILPTFHLMKLALGSYLIGHPIMELSRNPIYRRGNIIISSSIIRKSSSIIINYHPWFFATKIHLQTTLLDVLSFSPPKKNIPRASGHPHPTKDAPVPDVQCVLRLAEGFVPKDPRQIVNSKDVELPHTKWAPMIRYKQSYL